MSNISNKWLYCNVCFIYFEKDKLFRLTSCLHHICKDCFTKNSRNGTRCPVCKKCAGFVITSNDMDNNFLKLFDRRPMSFSWESRRIKFQHAQKMSTINKILNCKRKATELNTFIDGKKGEYLRHDKNHLQLRSYRYALQKKLIAAKKNQKNSNYRINQSMASNNTSNKSWNTTTSRSSIRQDVTGRFTDTKNSSVYKGSENSSIAVNANDFFNKYQTPVSRSGRSICQQRMGRLNLQSLKK